jgi:hypothetical protein
MTTTKWTYNKCSRVLATAIVATYTINPYVIDDIVHLLQNSHMYVHVMINRNVIQFIIALINSELLGTLSKRNIEIIQLRKCSRSLKPATKRRLWQRPYRLGGLCLFLLHLHIVLLKYREGFALL